MNEFEYVELVEHGLYNRGKIIRKADYKPVKVDYQSYMSVFLFKEEIINYIATNLVEGKPSISNYDGVIASDFLWIDIDSHELSESRDSLIKVMSTLTNKYDVMPNNLVIYFSGKKGFHLGIRTSLFGAQEYSAKDLNDVFKKMVVSVIGDSNCVDLKIYNKTRYLRTPLSRHQSTGNYKVAVDVNYIVKNNISDIVEMSKMCISTVSYRYDYTEKSKLTELFYQCKSAPVNITSVSVQKQVSLFSIPVQGERNDIVFRQAFRLFSAPKLKDNEVLDLMKLIYELMNVVSFNKGEKQMSLKEFETILNSAMRRSNRSVTSKFDIQSFEDMTPAIYDFIRKRRFVPTGILDIDSDLSIVTNEQGGLVLKNSYSIIGKYGTKKSIVVQNIAMRSAINDIDAMYVNGEMGDSELYKRGYSYVTKKNFTDLVASGEISQENIEKVFVELSKVFGSRFSIINKAQLTVNDIRDAINMREDKTGRKIYFVGIDSMNSMWNEKGNEMLAAVLISQGIKEVAKETETAIMLINHVTQICPHHTKDTSLYVRGGGKVLDNCDAFFCTSLIIDKVASNMTTNEERDIKYYPALFNLRFNNKRGTGRVIDKVMSLDDSLDIFETQLP